MVKWLRLGLGVTACATAIVCCQAVAGITDRELDPAWNQSSGSGYARRPPERSQADASPDGGVRRLFAAHNIYVGTIDPVTGKDDSTAWRRIGYDVDGKCTTAAQSQSDSTGVCKKHPAAQAESLEDGDECRDNAAGKLLTQGTVVLSGDFERRLNQKVQLSQAAGLAIMLEDLSDERDDPYVPGRMYVTVPSPTTPPLWNGSDVIAVDPTSVHNNDLEQPKYYFKDGYLRDNVWVSNDFNAGKGPVPLMIYDRLVEVSPIGMTFAAELNDTHDAILRSVLAVAMDMDQVKLKFAPVFLDMVCDPVQAALILNSFVVPNADLAAGPPPFIDPSKQCDAMSWGIMFDWVLIKSLKVSPYATPTAPACVDAGPDSADGGMDASDGAPDAGEAAPDASDAGSDAKDAAVDAKDAGKG
ncbi:MAG: hypothetical protein HY898_29770 [Deltaproteobacteria bacterium]|nr:hypothetical protein [Deltaproteobacteria bacterium]